MNCIPADIQIEAGLASAEMLANARLDIDTLPMCSLYSVSKGHKAIIELVKAKKADETAANATRSQNQAQLDRDY